jgi:hypothetical protein
VATIKPEPVLWRSNLQKLAHCEPGVVLDTDALARVRAAAMADALLTRRARFQARFPAGLRLAVSDLGASQHPLGLRALARNGVGFECRNLQQVLECLSIGEGAVVAFAPDYCASEEDYSRAVALGCAELVADDDAAANMLRASTKCWSAKLVARTRDGCVVGAAALTLAALHSLAPRAAA